jgi:CHAT domain-containing protein
LAETQQQRATVGTMLNNIGYTYSLQGDYAQALDHYQKSLTVAESLEEKSSIAFVLNNLGVNQRLQGSYLEALENLQKSLSLREGLGDKWGMAETLIEMAKTHYLRHDYTRAVESTERAIKLAKEIGDREKIWEALTQSGIAHRALDQLTQARAEFEEAISTIEILRGSVAGDEQTQQKVFAGKVSPYYEMVGLLIDQGHADEALVYAEYAKARVLLDVLRNGKVNIIRSMTAKEQEQEQVLRQTAFSLNTQISAERLRQKPDAMRLAQLQNALQKAHLDQEDFQSRLFAAHPDLQIQRGQIPRFTVQNSGSLLPDSSTALLEYAVMNDKTYLFVLSRATDKAAVEVKVFVVPIKRSELASKVESVRQKLATHNLLIRESARGAYDLLLKPAQALLRNKSRLIIVPDDVLWELPFQALVTESNHYLIEQSAISYAPSLTVLREMLAKRTGHHLEGDSNTSLLALGNPALGQATIERAQTTRDQKLVPLPEAEREVQTLAKLYGASKSEVLIGAEAREDRAKNDAGKFRVLHFATHGIVNNSSPMYSYLVLSQGDSKEDGLLEAWELLNMDLKADLVVLSACETARGRVGAGEGMIGLSWALFVAGTPTTVVSQWKVDSASTTELMLEFHRNLQGSNSKAQSLRKAMLKLLNTNQYKHPFYWAPFVVIGDAN